ncbi:MAG: hypothetical protein M3312_01065 [Actinomycetota bacterium]|nr:hypothetical protein [Actinomycetota bacterium]
MYGVELLWLPLGARGRFVRVGGKVYETLAALLDRRQIRDIYHSVLTVCVLEGRFVIEMGPVADKNGAGRGVLIEGPVGSRLVGRFRIFRDEVRCWREGITAYDLAVDSPRQVTDDPDQAERVLQLVRHVPALTWGRDQLRTGEMWSCNSLTSWLLTRSGLDEERIRPPAGGRAPGWTAGAVIARRQPQREGAFDANRATRWARFARSVLRNHSRRERGSSAP